MRCKHCSYEYYDDNLGSYEYPEKSCRIFGADEDVITEDNKGDYGCRYTKKTLDKLYEKVK